MDNVMSTQDEVDLSNDSPVDIVTATFTITETELVESDTENGTGTYESISVESDEYPLPITLRFFTDYTPVRDTDKKGNEWKRDKNGRILWVAKQRGNLKVLSQAVLGTPVWNRDEAVGKQFIATTRDSGDGYPTLNRFKAV
jgi:hypothetical protein